MKRFFPGRRQVLFLILGLIALGLATRPVYRETKSLRARFLAAQSEELMAGQKWAGALQKAGAAYQLSPDNTHALLAMARSYGPVNPDYALAFWSRLAEDRRLAPGTEREYIRFCLSIRRGDLAAARLARSLQNAPGNEELLLLSAEAAMAGGDWAKAAASCGIVIEQNPRNRQARLMLGGILFSSGQRINIEEARHLLEKLQDEKDEVSLQALILLSRWPDLPPDELQSLALKIRSHPLATEKEKLLAEELRIRAEPARRLQILDEAEKQIRSQPPAQRLETARWLNRQKEPARVLELMTMKEALSRQDLFLVWADAMALSGKWQELDEVLKSDPVPIEALLATIFRARALSEQGEADQAALLWGNALNNAGDRPEILWYMGAYAEKLGAYDQGRDAYLRLTRITAAERAAYVALINLLQKKGDTAALRDTYKKMLERFPRETTAVNDLAYLDLLLGENIPASLEIANRLVKQEQNVMAYRVTAALGCFRTGKVEEAYTFFATAGLPDIGVLKPSWQAVYAAIQGNRGRMEEARKVAVSITNNQLLPEERKLIGPYLE